MVVILDLFKNFNKDIYCPVKGYIGAKNEVYQQNTVRDIECFNLRGRGSKCARVVAIWDCFKNFNKDIYCPLNGYIRVKNEVYPQNRVRDI